MSDPYSSKSCQTIARSPELPRKSGKALFHRSSQHHPPQHIPQPLYLLPRVLVHRPDAYHPALALQAQPLGDGQRIVIAVPDENALRERLYLGAK